MPDSPSPLIDAWPRYLAGVLIIAQLVMVGLSWTTGITEIHIFRQAQTGVLIHEFITHGIDWRSPLPLLGPPWFLPFEFPLYQAVVATLCNVTGMGLESTAKLTALGFFYAGLPAVWFILRALVPRPHLAWWGVVWTLACPVFIYYSHAVLIESTAWCFSAWFLAGFLRLSGAESRSARWIAITMIAGILAGLVKVTTFAVFLSAALLFTLRKALRDEAENGTQPLRLARIFAWAALWVAPGFATAIAWVRYTDALKVAQPMAQRFTSDALHEFTMGTMIQRFTSEFWTSIWDFAHRVVITPLNLIVWLAVGLVLSRRQRGLTIVCLLGFLSGPLLFANLYAVHDYYFFGSALFPLVGLALVSASISDWPRLPAWLKATLLTALVGAQVHAYATTYFDRPARSGFSPPELTSLLHTATREGDVLLILGEDWNPIIPYYAERRAVMILSDSFGNIDAIHAILDALPPDSVGALVASGPIRQYPAYLGPLLEKVGARRQPDIESENTAIYLRKSTYADAISRLQPQPWSAFKLIVPVPPSPTLPRQDYLADSLAGNLPADQFSPLPSTLRHPFGTNFPVMEGRPSLDLHVPSDLVFPVTAHDHTLEVGLGISPSAYENPDASTDGVEVFFVLHPDEGPPIVLDSVFLQPSSVAADRGTQAFTIQLPAGARGTLELLTRPGPNQSLAFDWAYISWCRLQP